LDFTAISDFAESLDQRILAGNHLIKARNPVWVYCTIPYRLKPTAGSAFSADSAAQMIADYINAFDPNDNLDMNDLATQLRIAHSEVGTVFPFDIFYDLYSPDGQLLQFKTTDIVSIFSLSSNGVTLANSADIIVPPEMVAEGITAIDDTTLTEFLGLRGISDRVIKYRCDASMVSFEVRG
jgi:hypothetical protein